MLTEAALSAMSSMLTSTDCTLQLCGKLADSAALVESAVQANICAVVVMSA
jgi:hypothetical protein